METKKQSQNPVIFEIVIPWVEVQKAYQKKLTGLAAGAEIKGFRKGKAPMKFIEEKVGKNKIYSDVIEDVLPAAYQVKIKKRNIQPMISPRVKPINIKENKDWKFEITVVVKPEVELGNYEKQVQSAKIDKKQKEASKSPEAKKNKEMGVVFNTLLKVTRVELPQMLVDEEVNLRLTQLIDQVQSLGMTIEQYLQAKKLTNQQIRMEYEKTARDMLKLNLALDAIASEHKFKGEDRISKAVEFLLTL